MKGDVKRNTSPLTGHPGGKDAAWQPAPFPLETISVTGVTECR